MNQTTSETKLSLEAFTDMVLKDDSWKNQMPGIMAQLPSVDDALLELARMPEEKRHAVREKVARMQGEIGSYIGALGEEMRMQRGVVEQAQHGSRASNAYSKTESLVQPDSVTAAS